MSLILGKNTYFQYKSDCGLDFLTFITVLGMSKISKNIGFDALLVFVQQIYIFSPSFTVRWLFLPHWLPL